MSTEPASAHRDKLPDSAFPKHWLLMLSDHQEAMLSLNQRLEKDMHINMQNNLHQIGVNGIKLRTQTANDGDGASK